MAYTLLNSNGSLFLRVADNTIDQTTSITFVGKDYAGWGQYYSQNFVTLLTNSAAPNFQPPSNPQGGQLWYDTTYKKVRVWDATSATFISAGGATVGPAQPAGLNAGDFWYNNNTQTQTLNFYNGSSFVTIPTFPTSKGATGWVVPLQAVTDTSTPPLPKQVTLLDNYGVVLGAISNNQFTPSNSIGTFNTSVATVVNGLTIFGNIQSTKGLIVTPQSYAAITAISNPVAGQIISGDDNRLYIYSASSGWLDFAPFNPATATYSSTAPVHNTSTGNVGEIAWDNSYFYFCTGTNAWSRIGYTPSSW